MAFLSDLLFGSKPSSKAVYANPEQVGKTFEGLRGLIEGDLAGIASQALGGASAFGPGFQGNTGILAQKAILPYLMSLLQQSMPTVVQTPGSPGLVQTALGGLAAGAGAGLGAGIFGGGKPPLAQLTGITPQSSRMADLGILSGQSGLPRY